MFWVSPEPVSWKQKEEVYLYLPVCVYILAVPDSLLHITISLLFHKKEKQIIFLYISIVLLLLCILQHNATAFLSQFFILLRSFAQLYHIKYF